MSHGRLNNLGKLPGSNEYENKQIKNSFTIIFYLLLCLLGFEFNHSCNILGAFNSIHYVSGTASVTSKSPIIFYYKKRKDMLNGEENIIIMF